MPEEINMNYLVLLLSMGLVSYLLRLSMFVLLTDVKIPKMMMHALAFIPTVVFFSFILPDLLIKDSILILSPLNPRLLAGLGAAMMARKYKNVLLTMLTGFSLLMILNSILGW
jgi:branched-subunit amino acid transport protein